MACFLHKKNSNANSVHISIMKGDPIMLNIHAHKESTIYKSGISNFVVHYITSVHVNNTY